MDNLNTNRRDESGHYTSPLLPRGKRTSMGVCDDPANINKEDINMSDEFDAIAYVKDVIARRNLLDNKKMKVILISGKAEAGKTTTANFIKEYLVNHQARPMLIPYGNYVKTTAKELLEWNGKKDEKGRELLQWWGTD